MLPDGFQRRRYFGFLANRYRAEKLALCRQLMQMPPSTVTHDANTDYRDRYKALTGISLRTCPLCCSGTMVVIETFQCTYSRTFADTSRPSAAATHHHKIGRPCAITGAGQFSPRATSHRNFVAVCSSSLPPTRHRIC
ncbi:hypothetical protein HCN58_35240 [Bradyrhizobium sp. WSM 1791]|uniref:Transposase n=1 Tax=Bradyrhizobium australiense TaxID=2721161 RepID=A0A7Y4GZN8_9BRAD|nr:hypothetical protein [Bradyrhizobium australiense]NOJ44659.1 hypothetical protein [Bradyrhizobium australiense]